jgi:hypothetical protein
MPDDIEIGYSPLRMLRLVGMGAVMTLLSVSVAFNWFSSKRIDSLCGHRLFWPCDPQIHLDSF